MTPKQKALGLWTSYRMLLSLPNAPLGEIKDTIAKNCALCTVTEIQIALESNEDNIQNLDRERAWWNQVEKEINKL